MPGVRRRRQWQDMTRREIALSLTVFTIIGTAVVIACIQDLVVRDLGTMAIIPLGGVLFVSVIVGVIFVQAIRELRRRKATK
jgi:hypothetical protein